MRRIIKGGRVLDGSGRDAFEADVLIEDGVIKKLVRGIDVADAEVIDAAGLTVTPGFVDIHRHCDVAPFADVDFGKLELAQGITSVCAGNCGLASVPWNDAHSANMRALLTPILGELSPDFTFKSYADYTAALAEKPLPLNFSFLAAGNMIQAAARGAGAIEAHVYLREALDAGAVGVSIGLLYEPAINSTSEELARLLEPAAGRLLTVHIRSEGNYLLEAVEEVIGVAEQVGMRLHISHLKCTGVKNWRSFIYRAIEKIETARAKGLSISADFYPYNGAATSLLTLLPPSVSGSPELCDKNFLREALAKDFPGGDNLALTLGWDRIYVASENKTIARLAEERGYDYPSDYVADMLAAGQENAGVILFSMAQEDIDEIARLPWTALISDALYGEGVTHPRLCGAFPKFIREHALERGVLSLPQAVHKMTALPASVLGFDGRGLIAERMRADICVFNPENFKDHATWDKPRLRATGMEYVLVNGQVQYSDNRIYK